MRTPERSSDIFLDGERPEVLREFARLALYAATDPDSTLQAVSTVALERAATVCGASRAALLLQTGTKTPTASRPLATIEVETSLAVALGMSAMENETHERAAAEIPFAVMCDQTHWRSWMWRLSTGLGQASERALLLLGWRVGTPAETIAVGEDAFVALADSIAAALAAAMVAERMRDRAPDPPRSENEWEQVFDAVTDPMAILTPDFRIVRANSAYHQMLGAREDGRGAHYCFESADASHRPCATCPLPETVRSSEPHSVRQDQIMRDPFTGQTGRRSVQRWTYPILDADGEVRRVVEVLKDVTEQERLRMVEARESALRETDQLKSELLGTVSHELRSPLASIKGYADTLLRHERRLPPDERREFLRAIGAASNRLEVIIDQLLEMSQLETGALVMEREPVDVVRLAREALGRREQRTHSPPDPVFQFSFRRDRSPSADADSATPEEAPARVRGDPSRLAEVFDHLLENAVKYSPQGGRIEVVVADSAASLSDPDVQRRVLILISDSGQGIPEEHLGHIFDRFHRVDTRLTREIGGLGLGLAVCKRIIELHGGTIWAESAPGHGSTFFVELPIDEETAA